MKTGIGQSKCRNLTLFHVVWSVPAKVFLTVTFTKELLHYFVPTLLIIGLVKMTFGLVHANCSLPEWQAVKQTFFAPWTKCNDNCAIILCELAIQSWPPFQGLFSYMKFAVIIIFVFVVIDIFVVQLQCHSFIYYKQMLLTPSTLKFNGMQIFYRLSSSQW